MKKGDIVQVDLEERRGSGGSATISCGFEGSLLEF